MGNKKFAELLRTISRKLELISMKGHFTGYDWNADPENLTIVHGEITDAIWEALHELEE